MKVLITGASGRVGRAIHARLREAHELVGLDRQASATADWVGSVTQGDLLRRALRGVDVVIHTAALHAPHVGRVSDEQFEWVNVAATVDLARAAVGQGVGRMVFTSTTAVYGLQSAPTGQAAWLDEDSAPSPRTVYHRSKLRAEAALEAIAHETGLDVTVLRMSRCFPEPAPLMAAYRLHRGVDVRDVADAHALAASAPGAGFRRFIVSADTPFFPQDAEALWRNAPALIEKRCPALADAFRRRGWSLPASIDRVYAPHRALRDLAWRPMFGFEAVLEQLDAGGGEVLPPSS